MASQTSWAVGWVSRVKRRTALTLPWASTRGNHTPAGIEQNRAYSVNFPGTDLLVETDYCGIASGRKTDKSQIFDLFLRGVEDGPHDRRVPAMPGMQARGRS